MIFVHTDHWEKMSENSLTSQFVVTIHASVKQCQSFLKLSLYIPFLKKYFSLYNLYVELWELGIPCFNGSSWKSVWKRIKIFVQILRQRARSPRAKHYFWIWRPLEDEIVNTLVNIAKYILSFFLSSSLWTLILILKMALKGIKVIELAGKYAFLF